MSDVSHATQQTDKVAETKRRGGGPRSVIVGTGIVVAVAVVLCGGRNSFAAMVIASGLTLCATAALDWAVFHPRRFIVARVVLAGLVGGGIGYYFQLTEARAFQRAFGAGSPAGVSDCSIRGHYVGRLGDVQMLLQFSVDDATLHELLAQRPFGRDADKEDWYREEPEIVWQALFGGFAGNGDEAWGGESLPKRVRIYRWSTDRPLEQTTVLWDEETGRACVRYTFG